MINGAWPNGRVFEVAIIDYDYQVSALSRIRRVLLRYGRATDGFDVFLKQLIFCFS
jgi:hypothetical protein